MDSTTPSAVELLEQHMDSNRRVATFAIVGLDYARKQAEHIAALGPEAAALHDQLDALRADRNAVREQLAAAHRCIWELPVFRTQSDK